MAQQLVYTSSPKGLQPGAFGFCVVASTRGIPDRVASFLASTSGYRRVFAPETGKGALNPVAYTHMLVESGAQTLRILSRVADAGLDYTNRTNKIASFLLLDRAEQPTAGPAAILDDRASLFYSTWNQSPKWLEPIALPNLIDAPNTLCEEWRRATGSYDWGAALASTVYSGTPVTIVYAPDQNVNSSMRILKLFQESIRLLPPAMRWKATFSTYYMNAPLGSQCQWRAVLAGSQEEANLRANPRAILLDLTRYGASAPVPDAILRDSNFANMVRLARGEATAQATPPGFPPVPPRNDSMPNAGVPFPQSGGVPSGANSSVPLPPPFGNNAGYGGESSGVYAMSGGIEVPRGAKPVNYGRDWQQPGHEEREVASISKRKRANKKLSPLVTMLITFAVMSAFSAGGFWTAWVILQDKQQSDTKQPLPSPNAVATDLQSEKAVTDEPKQLASPPNAESTSQPTPNEETANSSATESESVNPSENREGVQSNGVANDKECADVESTQENLKKLREEKWQEVCKPFIEAIKEGKLTAMTLFGDERDGLSDFIGSYEEAKIYNRKPGILICRECVEKNTSEEDSQKKDLLLFNLLAFMKESKQEDEKQGSEDCILKFSLENNDSSIKISSNEFKIPSKDEESKDGLYESQRIELSKDNSRIGLLTLLVGQTGWIALLFEEKSSELINQFLTNNISLKIDASYRDIAYSATIPINIQDAKLFEGEIKLQSKTFDDKPSIANNNLIVKGYRFKVKGNQKAIDQNKEITDLEKDFVVKTLVLKDSSNNNTESFKVTAQKQKRALDEAETTITCEIDYTFRESVADEDGNPQYKDKTKHFEVKCALKAFFNNSSKELELKSDGFSPSLVNPILPRNEYYIEIDLWYEPNDKGSYYIATLEIPIHLSFTEGLH